MILDPRGLTVVEWTDRVNPFLGRYGTIPILDSPVKWRDWAAAVILFPGISGFNPPNPFQFERWMDWVDAFNKAVPNYI